MIFLAAIPLSGKMTGFLLFPIKLLTVTLPVKAESKLEAICAFLPSLVCYVGTLFKG